MQDLFAFIIHPLELGVVALAVLVNSAGLGIILFTIFVRLLLSPLTITQLRNAKAMQRLQPMLAELRQKHGKDKQALSQATMQLYKDHQVNPAMGCLPTVLQFPILIGLFYAFLSLGNSKPTRYPTGDCKGHHILNYPSWLDHCYRIPNAVSNPGHIYDLFHAQFLWLSNGLGQPDPLLILPILAGVTQWIQSRMMLVRSDDPQQKMMNTMMNFMPLMIVFFATRYASGLSLYWVTSTVIAIAIQYRITGWGLVPKPAFLFGTAAATVRSRSGRAASVRRAANPNKAASTTKAPSANTGSGQTEAVLAPAEGDQPATSPNGQDGRKGEAQGKQKGTAAGPRKASAATRKRANRARGGRGGGRRG